MRRREIEFVTRCTVRGIELDEEDRRCAAGLAPDEPWPTPEEDPDFVVPDTHQDLTELPAREVADCVRVLEYSDEATAGTGLFVEFGDVKVSSARWVDAPAPVEPALDPEGAPALSPRDAGALAVRLWYDARRVADDGDGELGARLLAASRYVSAYLATGRPPLDERERAAIEWLLGVVDAEVDVVRTGTYSEEVTARSVVIRVELPAHLALSPDVVGREHKILAGYVGAALRTMLVQSGHTGLPPSTSLIPEHPSDEEAMRLIRESSELLRSRADLAPLRAARWLVRPEAITAVRALLGPDRREPSVVRGSTTLQAWQRDGRSVAVLAGSWLVELPSGEIETVRPELFAVLAESRRIDVIGGEAD